METYIVRVLTLGSDRESDAMPEADGLHGFVRHVRSGLESSFASWEELRALIGRAPTAAPPSSAHEDG